MKGCTSIVLVLAVLLPATVAAAETSTARPVHVLLITGGHSYEREPLLEVFRENRDITLTHVEHAKGTADAWDRVDPSTFDVVVLHDMPRSITDSQKERFLGMLRRGTGLVVTHHALVSYQGWREYERIIGGRYIDVPGKGGEAGAKPSGYQHDVDIPVAVVRRHPVTAGLSDFTIHDEIYWDYRVGPDVEPLLRTTHPKSGNPLAWARQEGGSRVVYLLFGHGPPAFRDPNYRRLVANAIRWTAGDAPR